MPDDPQSLGMWKESGFLDFCEASSDSKSDIGRFEQASIDRNWNKALRTYSLASDIEVCAVIAERVNRQK